MTGDHDSPEVIAWRVGELEQAVKTMASAAARQQEFNIRVERFMSSARTWGKVALLLNGIGQAALVAVLARGLG